MRAILLISIILLSACTGATKLPTPSTTTQDVLNKHFGRSNLKERPTVHGRYVNREPDYRDYTYIASEQLDQTFSYLPNPTLTMYVFQHLTPGGSPVPGYVTRFKMYEKDHFALPGELPTR